MDGAVALNNFAKTLSMSGTLDENIPEPMAKTQSTKCMQHTDQFPAIYVRIRVNLDYPSPD